MDQRNDAAPYREALLRLGSVGEMECQRINAASDLNRRVIEAQHNHSWDEAFEEFEIAREEKIGGIASFDLQVELNRYLKAH